MVSRNSYTSVSDANISVYDPALVPWFLVITLAGQKHVAPSRVGYGSMLVIIQ